MKKKLLALSLSMVLTLGLMACGAKEDAPSEVEAPTEVEAPDNAEAPAEEAGDAIKVAIITMDQMDQHWVTVHAGAEAAVEKYAAEGINIDLTWLAPETKDNTQQIQKIEAAVADNVKYIIIAATDATAPNTALKEAIDQGVSVIYIDSPATQEASATFATDNYQGGVEAANYMLKYLEEQGITEGTIGIIDAQPGADSTQNRYDGFASVLEGTKFTMTERQYTDGDNVKAQEITNTLINDGVTLFYAMNAGAAEGCGVATIDAKKNGTEVISMGWDKTDANLSHVENGGLIGFIAQNPDMMGSMAIDAVVEMENGEDLGGKTLDTGISIVTPENVADFK